MDILSAGARIMHRVWPIYLLWKVSASENFKAQHLQNITQDAPAEAVVEARSLVDTLLTEAISDDFSQDAHGERNHVKRSVPPDLVDMAQERDAEESGTDDWQRVARTVAIEHKVAVSHGV
jgi:hypothetical protein